MDAKKIGQRLVALRGKKTQMEVAKACGTSIAAIGMYERGERIPRDDVKERLSEYYSVDVGELFFTD